jgi:molecular chaperone HtpG
MKVDKSKSKPETMHFQAQIEQLLDLLANNVYSNKETALRELVSNAADAIGKRQYASKQNTAFANADDYSIWVDVDKDLKTLTIRDNGIGMSKEDLINNLGTIAKSGTAQYVQELNEKEESLDTLIGKFGIGFYAAFVIADRVEVTSKKAGNDENEPYVWASAGRGEFDICQAEANTAVGTSIVLHLKEDQEDFMQDWFIRNIITKYSDHVDIPIMILAPKDKFAQNAEDGKDPEMAYEVINTSRAIWTKPKSQVKAEEYEGLFSSLSHSVGKPLTWVHAKVEGSHEYTMCLFVPDTAPFDLWNRDKAKGVRLYSRRTFIMDDAEKFLPMYLRFVKGVIDSADLPLNISREILQESDVVNKIRLGCSKKVLSALENMAAGDTEKYQSFWEQFGDVLKEGPGEDAVNKDLIVKLLRFTTLNNNSAKQNVSLQDYIEKMVPGQDKIYYVTADSYTAALNSPHLEIFKKNNIDVLLLSDRVDEWLVSHLTEVDGKKLSSVTKGALDLPEAIKTDTKQEEQSAKDFDDITQRAAKVLHEKVQAVRVTSRLTDSPACLVSDEQDMSANLKRILKQSGQDFMDSKPILEINPSHPLIDGLKNQTQDDIFEKWCFIMLNQAILSEGGTLEDPAEFVKNLNNMILHVMKK